jgi:hypothetical protein
VTYLSTGSVLSDSVLAEYERLEFSQIHMILFTELKKVQNSSVRRVEGSGVA